MKSFLILSFLLWIPEAFAVSRVGGGKVKSNSSGFEMMVPATYDRVDAYGADAVIARGPQVYTRTRGIIELFIRVAEFKAEFPDAVASPQQVIMQRFADAGWDEIQNVEYPCMSGFHKRNANVTSYIFTWGEGKGFVLYGPAFDDVDHAIGEMLQTLHLDPGGCSWK